MNIMTCREMEMLLRDMARQSQQESLLIEPKAISTRAMEPQEMPSVAAAHLASCPRCSAALERERRLTASLAALAGSLEPCEVPADVEARLLAAFRKHSRDLANRRPVFRLFAGRPAAWAAGAAAVIAVSLGVGLGVVLMEWQPSGAPGEPPVTPTESLIASQPADPAPVPGALRPGTRQPSAPTTTARRIANLPVDIPSANATPVGGSPATSSPEAAQAVLQRRPQVGSGFVPLFYGGDPQLLEAGQVWRVEMPRSALQPVGMPIVEESRAGLIQVDILVGEDGIARAIRLVQ